MTQAPNTPVGTSAEAADAFFSSGDAFKRTEMEAKNEIVSIELGPMPEDMARRRQIPLDDADFKATFPQGFTCLVVTVAGIDKFYEPDNRRVTYIPLYGHQGAALGRPKGRRSQAHIFMDAFEKCFGFRPVGADGRARAKGLKAQWGQHLGEAEIEGETREWGWDVPKTRLPDNYQYTGEVTRVKAFAAAGGGEAGGGGGVGNVELSEAEANAAIATALTGLDPKGEVEAAQRIMAITGLPLEWYQAASAGENILAKAHKAGLIAAGEDGKVIPAPAAAAAE